MVRKVPMTKDAKAHLAEALRLTIAHDQFDDRSHPSKRPKPPEVEAGKRCKATIVSGGKCSHTATVNGFCTLHWNGPLIRMVGACLEVRGARPPCGARTRSGRPCRLECLPGRKRCKWHGGYSTGPRTPEGKAKVAENLRRARSDP